MDCEATISWSPDFPEKEAADFFGCFDGGASGLFGQSRRMPSQFGGLFVGTGRAHETLRPNLEVKQRRWLVVDFIYRFDFFVEVFHEVCIMKACTTTNDNC